ncbi:MAG: pyridoxamine 5'-phosphate oxidase family protein [Kastovskya adunca ATA6-11-RM4]|jgi:hypothetical protein|nr:pyridoxamine 5'-phosphate oxidase family protein [Kastovskya adunca ATA6-11-RM4]
MERFSQLNQLLAHIWSEVEQGGREPGHPYNTPTFGTVSSRGASLRTVVLRRVDAKARSLLFHSDCRAQKIKEIQHQNRVTWHFWDSNSKQQLRLMGEADLHFDDELANEVWQSSHPKSLKIYVKPTAPNTKVDQPRSGLSEQVESVRLSELAQVASGRENFAVVRTLIDEIDFLHLHPEGNYRASFVWTPQGVESSWMIP